MFLCLGSFHYESINFCYNYFADAVYSNTYTTPSSPVSGPQALQRVPYFELLQVLITLYVNSPLLKTNVSQPTVDTSLCIASGVKILYFSQIIFRCRFLLMCYVEFDSF